MDQPTPEQLEAMQLYGAEDVDELFGCSTRTNAIAGANDGAPRPQARMSLRRDDEVRSPISPR